MSIDSLRSDLAAHRARIGKLAVRGQTPDQLAAVVRVELTENLYPLLEAILDLVEADVLAPLADVGAAVDELIDQSEEVLHPGTATAILAALAQGEAVARLLEAATAGDGAIDSGAAIAQYRALAQEVATHVASITLDPNGTDDEDAIKDDGDEQEEHNA